MGSLYFKKKHKTMADLSQWTVPAPKDTINYRSLVLDKFHFALNNDEARFETWQYGVRVDTIYYNVSVYDTLNAEKFSSFLIYWQCNGLANGDGCCMYDEYNGTVCTMMKDDAANAGQSLIYTYRMSKYEWQQVMAGFNTNQASYITAMDAIPMGTIEGLTGTFELTPVAIDTWGTNYMDAFNCAVTTANVYWKYTCIGWQVDWDPTPTDRYPRFGLSEKIWAGAIVSTDTTAATFEQV